MGDAAASFVFINADMVFVYVLLIVVSRGELSQHPLKGK